MNVNSNSFPGYRRTGLLLAAGVLAGAALLPAAETDIRRDATVAAIEQVMPSVVNIATKTIVPVRDSFELMYREMRHQRPFDEYYSLGSGVVIDEAGYLLTNDHVVQRAKVIGVRFGTDTNDYEATLVARDQSSDVALLKLTARPGEKFHAIKLAREDDLLLGETVLALGNPLGLGGSVTRGILSSKTRNAPLEGAPLNWKNWLQTDAPINQGNSGGPLVNLRGELIGINVQNVPGAQSIGFAIPVKQLLDALSDVFPTEFVRSNWFGARVKVGTSPLVVTTVEPESPAGTAGLQSGDLILQVNGRTPRSFIDFADLMAANGGSGAALTIQRGTEQKNLSIRLVPVETVFNAELIRRKIGLTLDPLGADEIAARYPVPDAPSVFAVTAVQEGSPAALAHLQPGMLIIAIDGQWAADIGLNRMAVAKMLYGKRKGDSVRLDLGYFQRVGDFNVWRPGRVELKVR